MGHVFFHVVPKIDRKIAGDLLGDGECCDIFFSNSPGEAEATGLAEVKKS